MTDEQQKMIDDLRKENRRLLALLKRDSARKARAHRCNHCGSEQCTFLRPTCDAAQSEMERALANGMPASGRHG